MIQLKQLKRLKYESFDYGKYEKLKRIFLDLDFEPDDIEEIDLSQEKAPSIPNLHCLQLLTNLQVLVLSHNMIHRFSGADLAKAVPKLQVLDMSHNLIEELDDLIDMGHLPDVHIIDLSGNFVTTYITRINMIEMLLCPKKYVKYNPVKILTACYNQIPVARLQGQAYDQQKQDRRVIERFPEELRPDELINTVSKYNHKNTLGKYSLEACPIPRKTRFKNLEYLNGIVITKLDIKRVTGVKHFKQALEDKNIIKRATTAKPNKKNQTLHEQYVKKYLKRMNRMIEGVHDDAPPAENPQDVDQLMIHLTQQEITAKQKELQAKKFSRDLWQVPLDVQFKDSEFAIGIEEFKQQQRQYAEDKKLKQELKKQKQKEKRRKRLKKKNKPDISSDGDSDPEMKRLFRYRKKPMKPKMNLSRDDEASYRSSESSLIESHSSSQVSSQEIDDDDLDQEESDIVTDDTSARRKKIPSSEHAVSAIELKKQLQQPKKKLADSSSKKKVKIAPKSQTQNFLQSNKMDTDTQQQSDALPTSYERQSQSPVRQITQLQRAQAESSVEQSQDQEYKLHVEGPSMIYAYSLKGDQTQVTAQEFRLGLAQVPAQRIVAEEIKEQTRATFQIRNKLSASHGVVTTKDIEEEKLRNIERLAIQARKEREENPITVSVEKKELYPSFVAPQAATQSGTQDHKGKNFWREMEKVKIKGDLSKQEFKKIKIPLESLVPTVEQGIPEELRVKFLFDDKNEKYKELVHYKEILEQSKNIREAAKELDSKMEIQGIKGKIETKPSDFDTVFQYLKQDPKFEIQNSYDPANQTANNIGRKRKAKNSVPATNTKVSTFDMREIVYGANEYDPQTEPKILEKDIMAQLAKEKGITVEERDKLYEWLAILDDIKLKVSKTDDKRLQRIEKKELERASSYAHLAYHYQKLKKYVSEDKLQKYVKMMGIPLDDIIQENLQATKIQTSAHPRNKHSRTIRMQESRSQGAMKRPSTSAAVPKEPDPVKAAARLHKEKHEMIQREQEINLKRNQNQKAELLSENGFMAEQHPNIVEFLKDKEKLKAQILKPPQSFEEMMEANVRRLQDQFQKKGTGTVSLEEQMMRYAQEVNEKQKNRERLKANIKQYIDGTQKKIDEFWQWEAQMAEQRNDKNLCFKRYVKMVREGQIKII